MAGNVVTSKVDALTYGALSKTKKMCLMGD